MTKGFFIRLAYSNIRKNYRFFIPRILSEAGLLTCFYIAITLTMDDRLSKIRGGAYMPTFMLLGSVVLALLSMVLMFYIGSFLMKQRKREFGLYNVLGMEKKHIARVLFFETILSSFFSILLGLLCGILFYKLCSLTICRLLHAEAVAGSYYIGALPVLLSISYFLVIDLITYLFHCISIARLKPVDLLLSTSTGEKEPKVKWLMLLLGISSLAGGYYISIVTVHPLKAMALFFVAVILVMIGTYFLFITGSIFVLKCLKRNKGYYYTPRHMPAVSGLLYRMKQNAVGLASIAILATGVLVMISTTVSLYSGLQETMDTNYPQDFYCSAGYENSEGSIVHVPEDFLSSTILKAADDCGLKTPTLIFQRYLDVSFYIKDGVLLGREEVDTVDLDNVASFTFITKETYQLFTGKSLDLHGNEVAICPISLETGKKAPVIHDSLFLQGKEYPIVQEITYFPVDHHLNSTFPCFGIVVSSEQQLSAIYEAQKKSFGKNASDYTERVAVVFQDRALAEKVYPAMREQIKNEISGYIKTRTESIQGSQSYYYLDSYWDSYEEYLGFYGTLLFLGILLGIVCLFATVLIIYYKQISEGYEDRTRFAIMQKIGMSSQEVRSTINSQVLLVFFLPLFVAGIHLIFASPILIRLLRVLSLSSVWLYINCALVTFAIFTIVYILIYIGTARTYYKIVR